MSDPDNRPSAPDYTTACIVMFGVNLAWVLMVIWALWGLLAAGALGWCINRAITRIDAARH